MVELVYIDETGSSGTKAAKSQPYLTLAAVIVDEAKVAQLDTAVRDVAWKHLGWVPEDFELHGQEIFAGTGPWSGRTPPQLLAAFGDAISILDNLELEVSYASIDKARLTARYGGAADDNAYRLALQFLLEKVDRTDSSLKILVADEQKEQQIRAIKMVADLKGDYAWGEVPSPGLKTFIDSMHFARSYDSPGVQIADLVAFTIQRARRGHPHPDVAAAISTWRDVVSRHTYTWREPWP